MGQNCTSLRSSPRSGSSPAVKSFSLMIKTQNPMVLLFYSWFFISHTTVQKPASFPTAGRGGPISKAVAPKPGWLLWMSGSKALDLWPVKMAWLWWTFAGLGHPIFVDNRFHVVLFQDIDRKVMEIPLFTIEHDSFPPLKKMGFLMFPATFSIVQAMFGSGAGRSWSWD